MVLIVFPLLGLLLYFGNSFMYHLCIFKEIIYVQKGCIDQK